jgi:hypothetical protein
MVDTVLPALSNGLVASAFVLEAERAIDGLQLDNNKWDAVAISFYFKTFEGLNEYKFNKVYAYHWGTFDTEKEALAAYQNASYISILYENGFKFHTANIPIGPGNLNPFRGQAVNWFALCFK